MDIKWNTELIDPQNLISISRGDPERMKKYLDQFNELIPQRIENLEKYLSLQDRKMIRQILHQMSPQLQFFGIPEVVEPIHRLEHEYQTISWKEMKSLVEDILVKLNNAQIEIKNIIATFF